LKYTKIIKMNKTETYINEKWEILEDIINLKLEKYFKKYKNVVCEIVWGSILAINQNLFFIEVEFNNIDKNGKNFTKTIFGATKRYMICFQWGEIHSEFRKNNVISKIYPSAKKIGDFSYYDWSCLIFKEWDNFHVEEEGRLYNENLKPLKFKGKYIEKIWEKKFEYLWKQYTEVHLEGEDDYIFLHLSDNKNNYTNSDKFINKYRVLDWENVWNQLNLKVLHKNWKESYVRISNEKNTEFRLGNFLKNVWLKILFLGEEKKEIFGRILNNLRKKL
jgi:hypothetical protein